LAIAACFIHTAIAFVIFVTVAVMWFIPDKRIEQALSGFDSH
jgi:F0F1-type ATP synthase membrane subunit b/b'